MDRLAYPIATFRARPLPLVRHCIGLALIATLLVTGLQAVSGQQEELGTPSLARINSARASRSASPLEASEQLNQLAASYLSDLLERRSLTPTGYGSIGERILSEDVASAIGEGGYQYRYTGVVVTYGVNVENAMQVATGTRANGPALFEPAMRLAGVASAVIPAGDPWIAPPPGGIGLDIDLTGMTIIVIVTAGQYRVGG